MEHDAVVLLFLALAVLKVVLSFESVNKKIDSIQTNCNFDKGGTDKIRDDLKIVMHQVDYLINGDKDGLKILIYDDEDESANQLAEKINLVNQDCRIKISTNIQNARHQLSFWNPAIVFADLKHHGEDYGTLFKAVMKEDESEAKFILYSGAEKPEKYKGIFLDKLEIMKNPDMLKDYL